MDTKTTNTNTLSRLTAGQCPVCGSAESLVHFYGKTLPVTVSGLSGTVSDLAGEHCQVCEEIFLDDDSAKRFANAGDALVMETRRSEGAHLKALRKRLGLTQGEVGLLIGGGHNGVSRYERGQSDPGPAAFNLLHLLNKNPLLAGELPGVMVTKVSPQKRHFAATAKAKGFKPNKVIHVGNEWVVINVCGSDVLGTGSRAGKRTAATKEVDVSRLVAAKAATERPGGPHAKRTAAKSAVAKKAR
ncbi:type II toxin-antitoxin system MqsA family antitoxin [Stenotrophomonas sp. JAI102]|uniref:type II toxin-antitoxin system MqsA family antitoxin n=1 Tax=Stenotrophomonas sp. JAI102 TaxID=2723077 RepID=UPI0015C7928A|nr:type II toxin-antitoxin system MqsA family antitoxin [Stenotrophomonas sp. JAI102]NYF36695.1 putative zinc finger/helix-turn-helix YgiT family protein [Stenotrophomonas sp. JAI102]